MKKAMTFVAAALAMVSLGNPLTAYAAGTTQGKVVYKGTIGNSQELTDGSVNWESFGNGLVGGVVIWKEGCTVLPDFPGNSQKPDNPGTPNQPEEKPESPGTPEQPEEMPDSNGSQDSPDTPENPGTPNQPGETPDSDGSPENPGTPNQPEETPDSDGSQENPGMPNQPEEMPDSEGSQDSSDTPETSPEGKTYAQQVVDLVNAERAKEGLAPLTVDEKIADAAAIRAREITGNFSHTRPNGTSFSTALKEAGATYRRAGENIAWGQKTPAEVVNAWMNSTGHRANIMSKNYSRIGVAYYQEGGKAYWAQLFAD